MSSQEPISAEPAPHLGRILKETWRLEAVVGRGGMGIVYRARHEILGSLVAVKVLEPPGGDRDSHEKRFILEAQTIGRLVHPHTVRIYDFGWTDDGAVYYVMELLEGLTLGEKLAAQGPLGEDEALRLGRDVARSLAEAHARGVVHRDIKPANIFLTRIAGEPDHIKVVDFGVVKMTGESGRALADLTTTGMVCGSAPYMAPEQARGEEVDGRADLYGLGCTLFHSLTGTKPYEGVSPVSMMLAHVEKETPRVADHRPDIAPATSELVARLMEKTAGDRPACASELAAELDRMLKAREWARSTVREMSQAWALDEARPPDAATLAKEAKEAEEARRIPSTETQLGRELERARRPERSRRAAWPWPWVAMLVLTAATAALTMWWTAQSSGASVALSEARPQATSAVAPDPSSQPQPQAVAAPMAPDLASPEAATAAASEAAAEPPMVVEPESDEASETAEPSESEPRRARGDATVRAALRLMNRGKVSAACRRIKPIRVWDVSRTRHDELARIRGLCEHAGDGA